MLEQRNLSEVYSHQFGTDILCLIAGRLLVCKTMLPHFIKDI